MFAILIAALGAAPQALPADYATSKGRWTAAGGGPSHTGVSNLEPVRAPIEVAWSVDFGGRIEGEPLVWDGQVLVATQAGSNTRELHALDLVTSEPIARPLSVRTATPLAPSIWSGSIAYRSSADEVTSARLSRGAVRTLWTLAVGAAGAPLAAEDGVYVAGASGLHKRALARDVERWKLPGVFTGAPALLGEHVLAVELRKDVAYLVRVDRASGTQRSACLLGPLRSAPTAEFAVSAFPECAFVQLGAPLALSDSKRVVDVLGIRYSSCSEEQFAAIQWSAVLRGRPVLCGDRWLGGAVDNSGAPLLASIADDESGAVLQLADARTHPELVELATLPTVVGPQLIVGATAIDLGSRTLEWTAPVAATERAVVARDTVLFVDAARRIVAVRTKAARVDVPIAADSDAVVAGLLALRGGDVEQGEFKIDRAAGVITRSGASWPMAQVLALADGDSQLRCGVEPLRGVAAIARFERGWRLVALAELAKSAGDIELLERLIDEAVDAGVAERDIAKLDQYATNARKSRNRPSVKADLVAQVLAQRAGLERSAADVSWRFAQALLGEQRERYFLELARRTIEDDPQHAVARAAIRGLVPPELRPPEDFDPFDALDLLEAIEHTPVRVVPPAKADGAVRNAAELELHKRRASWPAELLAIESRDLLVITPVKQLGALARCLAYGERVCAALDDLYGVGVAGDARTRLVIELYASRDDYVDGIRRARPADAREREQTRGHYDLIENVSRFYMDGPGSGREEVLRVMAHELTHHWLRARSPRWPLRDVTLADQRAAGFWVVEGAACLVEQLDFDLVRRSWSIGGARSSRLDLVAHADPRHLIPWEKFFGLTNQTHGRIEAQGEFEVPVSLVLGVVARPEPIDLFYAQAEATAHYLFSAEDGALRPKLFEFLESYYSARYDELDLPERLGVGAEELGRRIAEHCRTVLR